MTARPSPARPGATNATTRTPRRFGTVRPKGRGWEARWIDADGRERSKTIHGTREDADLFVAQQAVDAQRGLQRVNRRYTLRKYGPTWLDGQRDRLRKRSVSRYRDALAHWLADPIADRALEDVELADIRSALGRMAQGGRGRPPAGAGTRAMALAVLRLILDEALIEGYVTRNLARSVRVPKSAARVTVIPRGAELARLRAAVDADTYRALWLLGMLGGLRIGEALALRWKDVDLDHYRLRVVGTLEDGTDNVGDPKSARGERTVIMHPDLRDALADWRRESVAIGMRPFPASPVFMRDDGTHYRAETQRERFARLCDRSGVRRFRFHDLRHHSATALAEGGTDARRIMDHLGHASLGMTARYTHMEPDAAAMTWSDLREGADPTGAYECPRCGAFSPDPACGCLRSSDVRRVN